MIISEKQIMQLILIARTHIEKLNNGDMMEKVTAYKLSEFLYEITCQQSEEFKEIKSE